MCVGGGRFGLRRHHSNGGSKKEQAGGNPVSCRDHMTVFPHTYYTQSHQLQSLGVQN